MKIYLKKDWDYPSSLGEKDKGHFIGREKEKNQLINELKRKNNGSILVSGTRGIGKTSLVYEAINNIDDDSIVPIVMNASQLELYVSGDEGLARIILINLIRRLYGHFKSIDNSDKKFKKLKKDIGSLYKKAVAKEVTIQESLITLKNREKKHGEKDSSKSNFDIDKYFLSSALAIIVLLLPDFGYEYVNIFLSIILFLLPNFKFSKTKEKFKNLSVKDEVLTSAEEFYKHDNSLSNLEHEFNELLKNIFDYGKRIIFVIDELDKIKIRGDNKTEAEKDIFSIIKIYKNLFTLSSALFIFITSDDDYRKVIGEKDNRGYNYTLFTNRIFLSRPHFDDLEYFIDDIILKIEIGDKVINNKFIDNLDNKELELFRNFKNYLCYQSKSDYFELYFIIRDFISYYGTGENDNNPIIEITKLSFYQRLQSKLQKVLGQIFIINSFKEQSKWHKNDVLLSHLYNFMQNNFNKNFTVVDKNNIIIDYLIPYLSRLQIIQEQESAKQEEGEAIVYQWTNNIPGEDGLEDVKGLPGILFEEEKKYKNIAQKYVQQVNDIDDLVPIIQKKRKPKKYTFKDEIIKDHDGEEFTGINAYNIFSEHKPYIDGLLKDCPENVNSNDLEEFTEELNDEIEKLKTSSQKMFTEIIKKVLLENKLSIAERQLPSDPQLFSLMNTLRDEVITKGLTHYVILNEPEKSKQLLITLNLPSDLLSFDNLKLLEDNKSYKIINIQTDSELDYSDKNKITEDRKRFVPKRKGGKKKKMVIEQVDRDIKSFININLEDDYQVFIEPLREVVNWFNK